MKTLLIAFLFASLSLPLLSATLLLPPKNAGPSAPVDSARIAVIAVDMWNWHWCKTSTMRVGALVPRMNLCLEEMRKMGIQVFLCPTDVADNYVGTPMVEKVLAVPPLAVPRAMKVECPAAPDGGGCTCGPGHRCQGNYGWDGMHPDLIIGEDDLIPNDPEMLHAILQRKGITHLIFMGVHTQVCLLGKSIGMRAMLEAGYQCFLARDLTDAHGKYDPVTKLTPDHFTEQVVQHFDKYLAPSINMVETLQAAGHFPQDAITDPVRVAPWGTVSRPHHFENSVTLAVTFPTRPKAEIRYTLDGSEPTTKSARYTEALVVTNTVHLKAAAYENARAVAIPTHAYFVRQNATPPSPDIVLSTLIPRRAVGPGHSPSFKDHRFAPISNPPQTNLSNRKQSLRIRGKTYETGLGVHAPNQLIYDLNPDYTRFVALAGIDDHVIDVQSGSNLAMHPSVIFRVFIDGKMAAESPIMRISEPAWRFDVPIPPGSKMISLAATDAGNGSKEDVANWVDCGFVNKK